MRHVHRVDIGQPDMAVDAGAFVKPTLKPAGIHPHDQHVGPAGVRVLGDVEIAAFITADFPSDAMSIEPDQGVSINAVKLQPEPLARVICGSVNVRRYIRC